MTKPIPKGRTPEQHRAIISERNRVYHATHRDAILARKRRDRDMRRLLPRARVTKLATGVIP